MTSLRVLSPGRTRRHHPRVLPMAAVAFALITAVSAIELWRLT